MADARSDPPTGLNRLLAALPAEDLARLLPDLRRVPLTAREVVYERDAPIPAVLFPLSGVLSLVIALADGPSVEAATVGNEGVVGTPVFLGTDRSPTRVQCLVPGEALRLPAEAFAAELSRAGALHSRLRLYTQALLTQLAQSAACNHFHTVERRIARWLLMTHDRVGADEFPLTQEFLSETLGVRRASVTVVAGSLQERGLIRSRRGVIAVLDRAGLEAACCECYAVVRREYERLLR